MEAARRMSDAATPSADIVDARALVSVLGTDLASSRPFHVRFSEVTSEVGRAVRVDARMFRRIFGSSSKTPKPGRESAAREGDTVDRDAPPEPDTVDADEDHGLHPDEEDVVAEPSNTDAFAPELRALFNSNLLSDHRAHAGKLSALAQSLETHPAVRTHPNQPSSIPRITSS